MHVVPLSRLGGIDSDEVLTAAALAHLPTWVRRGVTLHPVLLQRSRVRVGCLRAGCELLAAVECVSSILQHPRSGGYTFLAVHVLCTCCVDRSLQLLRERRPLPVDAPCDWKPDSSTATCTHCSNKFHLMNRKVRSVCLCAGMRQRCGVAQLSHICVRLLLWHSTTAACVATCSAMSAHRTESRCPVCGQRSKTHEAIRTTSASACPVLPCCLDSRFRGSCNDVRIIRSTLLVLASRSFGSVVVIFRKRTFVFRQTFWGVRFPATVLSQLGTSSWGYGVDQGAIP